MNCPIHRTKEQWSRNGFYYCPLCVENERYCEDIKRRKNMFEKLRGEGMTELIRNLAIAEGVRIKNKLQGNIQGVYTTQLPCVQIFDEKVIFGEPRKGVFDMDEPKKGRRQ